MRGRQKQRTLARRRIVLVVLACAAWSLTRPPPGSAASEEIQAIGRYNLGDNDTRLDGHRLALLEAKRNALEKAGTYVESFTEVKDFQLTRDDIRTYTAGLVSVEEQGEPKWEMVASTLRCTVTVTVRVDKDSVTNKIAGLTKDKQATQEMREAHKNTVDNERKVADLNKQLKKTKKGSPAAKRAKASRDHALAGIDAATLKAQAVGMKEFSKAEWTKVSDFFNRNVNMRGCMPFKSTQKAPTTTADRGSGLLFVTAPALAFAISKPRKKRDSTRRCKRSTSSSH